MSKRQVLETAVQAEAFREQRDVILAQKKTLQFELLDAG